MATSPSSELRVLSITEFELSPKDSQWYWTTKAANGEPVGDGAEGYGELRKAVSGFFVAQGIRVEGLKNLPENQQQYSKLVQVSPREFHIRKYAYGAPDPFDPDNPSATVEFGWVPPTAKEATPYE